MNDDVNAREEPTHIVTIEVPLRSLDRPPRSLEAVMELVRLAFLDEVCDNVVVSVRDARP